MLIVLSFFSASVEELFG